MVALAGILAASACGTGGSDRPRTLPPVSTTPAAAATSAGATDDEAAALAAATAVVRQYFTLLNAETTTSVAQQLAALMTRSCACRKVAQSTREVALAGNHYFGKTKVTDLSAALNSPSEAQILVQYDFTRSGIARRSGQVVSTLPGRRGALMSIRIQRDSENWLISELLYVRDGELR
jgi:glutamate-1-semialdehyde aminotransferase